MLDPVHGDMKKSRAPIVFAFVFVLIFLSFTCLFSCLWYLTVHTSCYTNTNTYTCTHAFSQKGEEDIRAVCGWGCSEDAGERNAWSEVCEHGEIQESRLRLRLVHWIVQRTWRRVSNSCSYSFSCSYSCSYSYSYPYSALTPTPNNPHTSSDICPYTHLSLQYHILKITYS